MRFTVVLYTDTEVSEDGSWDDDAVYCSLMDELKEWQPDKDPYWCSACDSEFKNWDAAKAHLGNKS